MIVKIDVSNHYLMFRNQILGLHCSLFFFVYFTMMFFMFSTS